MSDQSNRNELERLGELLREMTHGDLAAEKLAEIESILESSPDAREYYLQYIDVDVLLTEHWGPANKDLIGTESALTHSVAQVPAPMATVRQQGWLNLGSMTSIMMFVLAGLLAANLYYITRPGFNIPNQPNAELNLSGSDAAMVPRLVSMTACVWRDGVSPNLGDSVAFGDVLELREGIADFQVHNQFGEKARIRVEGPASVFVKSDGQLGLHQGVLTSQVDCRLGKFVIDTAMGIVTLSGETSIGIEATVAAQKLHVFKGRADLQRKFPLADEPSSIVVQENEAIAFNADREGQLNLTLSNADERVFASNRTMGFDQLDLPAEYCDVVLEAKPDIYWRFDNHDTVKNEVADDLSGLVSGAVQLRSFGDNVAAEFGLSSRGGGFVSDGLWPKQPLDSYTIELWVKPSHFHNGALIGFCVPEQLKDGRFPHGMLIETGGPFSSRSETLANQYRFLHRSPPSGEGRDGTSCYTKEGYDVRIWQHIVARKENDRLDMFVDGRLCESEIDATALPEGMQVVVGQLYPNRAARSFCGQLDEVAIYSRALSDEEIKLHFDVAKSKSISVRQE